MDESNDQLKTTVIVEGNFCNFLEGDCILWLRLFLQRIHCTFGATTSFGTIAAILPVIYIRTLWSSSLIFSQCYSITYVHRSDSTMSYQDALQYACGLLILNGAFSLSSNQFFMKGFHNGMKIRVAVCSIIYRKVRPKQRFGYFEALTSTEAD